MSVFGDNIAKLRAEKHMSQRALAQALGISNGTVAAWETKGTLPNVGTMDKLQEIFGVTAGERFTPHITARSDNDYSSQELRVFGRIAAGTPIEMVEGDFGFPCPTYLIKRYPRAFFLQVEGESMSRILPNGCYVLVDPEQREPIINQRVYAVCVNGYDATVKRVRYLANGIELIPDSLDPTYHTQVYDATVEDTESITIIGRVVWHTFPFDWEY
jgi:repressor LexA